MRIGKIKHLSPDSIKYGASNSVPHAALRAFELKSLVSQAAGGVRVEV